MITKFLNATLSTFKELIPIKSTINHPELIGDELQIHFGVFMGIYGELNGRLLVTGTPTTFSLLGEKIHGYPLDEKKLTTFSDHLGNQMASGIYTKLYKNDIETFISAPTIFKGNTNIYGYDHGIDLAIELENIGVVNTCFLIE